MANPKHIIAVCTTRIQSYDRISFIEGLYKRLDKDKYKIIVFNSPSDFGANLPGDIGAKSVYDIINYDRIDCLVIDKEHFWSGDIFNEIIGRAGEKHVPVIVLNSEVEGCFCICNKYEAAYEELISHLIFAHNYRDFFFIGGIKGETESEKRLEIFRRTLCKNGVDFNDEKVAYGQFYEYPVYGIFDELYEKNELPQVFVCANDTMAFAVYQKAREYGLRIPEDIAVTGFDGLPYSQLMTPPLATCEKSYDETIRIVEHVIEGICSHTLSPGCFYGSYKVVVKGSCGCKTESISLSNEGILHAFRDLDRFAYFEEQNYNIIEKAIDFDYQGNIYETLITCSEPGSSICIKGDYASTLNDLVGSEKGFSDKFYILPSKNDTNELNAYRRIIPFEDMVPYFDEWMKDDTLYMVTSIYVVDSVCGHYTKKTVNVGDMAHRFNRTGRAINIIMEEAVTRYKQRNIIHENAKALNIDPLSGLPNLKSLTNWFHSFASVTENRKKSIMVSLYWIPKYKEFYEQYGLNERDKIITYISEILKIANAQNSFVSQIAEDEFVVVNYVDEIKEISNTINNATNVFYGLRDNFEQKKRQQYGEGFELEVNCGCTYSYSGWSDSVEIATLIKMARTEMYANKLQYSRNGNQKSSRSLREDYNALMLLVSQNRFIYHYQPIIDVKDRSIYAYEALMRTEPGINMSPLDILATAESYQKMYDIERATVFNVLEQYSHSQEELFHNRKVFINSIPGHFLNECDRNEIITRYSDYIGSVVFEITEGYVASDEEIEAMKTMGSNGLRIPLAIDDYGSGCSNIVNLLKYAPQIIKVDRALITDIDKDANKRMFMKGTLEFASANQIKVLAEGVETREEFITVVALGVDYVQGFYTGKPTELPMADIPEFVVSDIESALQETM